MVRTPTLPAPRTPHSPPRGPERSHLTSSRHAPHEVFPTPLGNVGLLICWDLAFPEAFRELIAAGAQLIIIPTFWTLNDCSPAGLAHVATYAQVLAAAKDLVLPVAPDGSWGEATDLVAVRTALQEAGLDYESADAQFVPSMEVTVDAEGAGKVMRLVEALEDLDDVQNVFANVDIPDEVLASLDA